MVKIDFNRPGLDVAFTVGKDACVSTGPMSLDSWGKALLLPQILVDDLANSNNATPQDQFDSWAVHAWAAIERKRLENDTLDTTAPQGQEPATDESEVVAAAVEQDAEQNICTHPVAEQEADKQFDGEPLETVAEQPAVDKKKDMLPSKTAASSALSPMRSCWEGLVQLLMTNATDPWSPSERAHAPAREDWQMQRALRESGQNSEDLQIQHALRESASLYQANENSTDEARIRLQQVMDLYNAKALPVKADGNCQFRALSLLLEGSEDDHESLRARVVARLVQTPDRYKDFVHEEYSEYVERMARDGQWGDNVTLQAASDVIGIDIRILTDQPGAEYVEVHPFEKTRHMATKPLCLTFLTEMHYDAAEFLL